MTSVALATAATVTDLKPSGKATAALAIQLSEESFDGFIYFHLAFDPRQVSLDVVFNPPIASPAGKKQVLVFNGGYFDMDHRPSGLLIAGGKQFSLLSINTVLSGIFRLEAGKAVIEWASDYKTRPGIGFALQNGPLVIEPGGKKGISPKATKREKRTILAIDNRGSVHVVVFKTKISLFDAQNLLLKQIKGVYAAMNLDGGPSTYFSMMTSGRIVAFGNPAVPAYFIRVTPK